MCRYVVAGIYGSCGYNFTEKETEAQHQEMVSIMECVREKHPSWTLPVFLPAVRTVLLKAADGKEELERSKSGSSPDLLFTSLVGDFFPL